MRSINTTLVQKTLLLLPKDTPRHLMALTLFQVLVTTLDIIALLLLGTLSKSGLDYIQGRSVELSLPFFNNQLVVVNKTESLFIFLAVTVVILFSLRTLISIWGNKKILDYLGKQSAIASKNIVEQLFASKPQYILSKKSQELLFGVTRGVDGLVLTYLGSLTLLFAEVFFLIMIAVSLIALNPIVGVCALIVFGVSGVLINKLTSTQAKSKSKDASDLSIVYSQRFLETLGLYRELFLRGGVTEVISEVQDSRNQYLKLRAELLFLPILTKFLFEFILILGGALVAAVQLSLSSANEAIAAVVVFLAAASRILPSLIRSQNCLLSLKQSEGVGYISLQQIEEFRVNRNQLYLERSNRASPRSIKNYITFENVSFRYPNSNRDAISNMSVTIRKGELVAIVGESGSGKSTFSDLLLGMQEPTKGIIRINGYEPREVILSQPGSIAYVPQEISITDGTILSNIVLTSSRSQDEMAIKKVLKRAALLVDIKRMPMGIYSIVGERGTKLSGGQRQRLGIARALYTKPDLIVFDEATSSLDPITEKVVTEAIYKKNGGVTLIVIAHRLSTVKSADKIILIEKGKLVAVGSFEEVRRQIPKFDLQAKLVNL